MPDVAATAPHPGLWTVEALLVPSARWFALAVMAASFVFPVGGLGFDLCMLHSATGLPCPGCGMSRAIAAVSQGQLSTALALNPFALFAWPTFLVLAVLAVSPRPARAGFEAWLRGTRWTATVYRLVFWAFLGFGLIRLSVFLVLGERFP